MKEKYLIIIMFFALLCSCGVKRSYPYELLEISHIQPIQDYKIKRYDLDKCEITNKKIRSLINCIAEQSEPEYFVWAVTDKNEIFVAETFIIDNLDKYYPMVEVTSIKVGTKQKFFFAILTKETKAMTTKLPQKISFETRNVVCSNRVLQVTGKDVVTLFKGDFTDGEIIQTEFQIDGKWATLKWTNNDSCLVKFEEPKIKKIHESDIIR